MPTTSPPRRARRLVTAVALTLPMLGAATVLAGAAQATVLTISGSMEGNLQIVPGHVLKAGYDFTIPGGPDADDHVTVTDGRVTIEAECLDGTSSPLVITFPDQSYTVPAHDGGDWFPSGDQSSPLVYQGSVTVPSDFCGGHAGRAPDGAVFTANFLADSSKQLNVRMHYVDYSNKQSSSWSGTAHVVPSTPPGTVTLCKVAGDNVAVGDVFSFTVGSTSVDIPAGAAPQGNCVSFDNLPLGRLNIKEKGSNLTDVKSIVVSPAASSVYTNLAAGREIVDVTSTPTTVTYTNVAFVCHALGGGRDANGTPYREFQVQDPIGIDRVYADKLKNATYTTTPYTSGTTDPVVIRVTRVDPTVRGHATIFETNLNGVTHHCDPSV